MKSQVLTNVRDIAIDRNCAWIISDSLKWLLKCDLLKSEIELVAPYPQMMGTDHNPFSKIVKIENEIYFIPLTAKDIFYYCLNEKKFYKLNILLDTNCYAYNMQTIVKSDVIYFIERFSNRVIKIDTRTKRTKIFVADNDFWLNKKVEGKIYRFYKSVCLYDGKIIWPNYGDTLTIFDISKEKFFTIILNELNGKGDKIVNANAMELSDWIIATKFFGGSLWLLSFEGNIYELDSENYKIKKCWFSIDRKSDKQKLSFFADMISQKDELWFISQYENGNVKYSNVTKRFEMAGRDAVQIGKDWETEYSFCKAINEEIILASDYYKNLLIIFNTKNNHIERKAVQIPIEKFIIENEAFRNDVMSDKIYPFDNLHFFCDDITCRDDKMCQLIEKNIGRKIYEFNTSKGQIKRK